MLRKLTLALCVATTLGTAAIAQDVHFTQFNLSPLTINPAFTGMHNGLWRVNGIYRNQWNSVTIPYVTAGLSFDAPIYRGVGDNNYLSGGLELFTDKSGDGNLMNNTIMGSLAYHKAFGENENMSLSLGMQGGYVQKSIDLSRLYFQDQFRNGGYQPGTSAELLKNRINNFIANVGVAWSHGVGSKFAYTVGAAAYNLNQPLESFQKQKANGAVGLGMRINAQLGADWFVTNRFQLRPAVLFQTQQNAQEIIAGSEVRYVFGDPDIRSVATAAFLGGYTRLGDAALFTGGVDYNGFRFSVGYDMTSSSLNQAAAGVGSYEIGISYVKPNPIDFARRLFFPCARF